MRRKKNINSKLDRRLIRLIKLLNMLDEPNLYISYKSTQIVPISKCVCIFHPSSNFLRKMKPTTLVYPKICIQATIIPLCMCLCKCTHTSDGGHTYTHIFAHANICSLDSAQDLEKLKTQLYRKPSPCHQQSCSY